MLRVCGNQPLPIARNVKRKVRAHEMKIRERPSLFGLETQDMDLFAPILPGNLKTDGNFSIELAY